MDESQAHIQVKYERVAVCCSVLQCVAACCSVLQCIVVCCSVLHIKSRTCSSNFRATSSASTKSRTAGSRPVSALRAGSWCGLCLIVVQSSHRMLCSCSIMLSAPGIASVYKCIRICICVSVCVYTCMDVCTYVFTMWRIEVQMSGSVLYCYNTIVSTPGIASV